MTRLDPNPPVGSADPGSRRSRPPSRRSPSPHPIVSATRPSSRVGLADDYAVDRLAARPAPGRLERSRRVGGRRLARTTASSSRRSSPGPAAARSRADVPAAATRPGRRAAACRRPSGPDRARPARLDRVRAGRLAEGARDPPRRGPAVRLDRRRDRPAEGGPGGRDGARPQPDPAHRPVPPRRPDRRLHRQLLARRARRTSGRSSPSRAPTPTGWRRSPAPASATSARTRRGSTACRPATTPARHDRASPGPVPLLAAKPSDAGYRPCLHCRPLAAAAGAA